MSHSVLAVVCLVVLVGCATPATRVGPFSYSCNYGSSFVAVYDPKADRMSVTAGGVTRILPHVLSATGAHYANDQSDYWGKGRNAALEGFPGGPYVGCNIR